MSAYRDALEHISRLRPAGDVETCNNPRKLVQQMETIALAALAATPTPPTLSEDLREALKPFADIADFYDSCEQHPNGCPDSETTGEMVDLTVGDFRRARAALARAQGQAS